MRFYSLKGTPDTADGLAAITAVNLEYCAVLRLRTVGIFKGNLGLSDAADPLKNGET